MRPEEMNFTKEEIKELAMRSLGVLDGVLEDVEEALKDRRVRKHPMATWNREEQLAYLQGMLDAHGNFMESETFCHGENPHWKHLLWRYNNCWNKVNAQIPDDPKGKKKPEAPRWDDTARG